MNYSPSDIEHMREDALRRTREMHSRARGTGSREQRRNSDSEPRESVDVQAETVKALPLKEKESSESSFFGGILPNMKVDGDTLLIMLLIIILANEGADMKLLLALGYILM